MTSPYQVGVLYQLSHTSAHQNPYTFVILSAAERSLGSESSLVESKDPYLGLNNGLAFPLSPAIPHSCSEFHRRAGSFDLLQSACASEIRGTEGEQSQNRHQVAVRSFMFAFNSRTWLIRQRKPG